MLALTSWVSWSVRDDGHHASYFRLLVVTPAVLIHVAWASWGFVGGFLWTYELETVVISR